MRLPASPPPQPSGPHLRSEIHRISEAAPEEEGWRVVCTRRSRRQRTPLQTPKKGLLELREIELLGRRFLWCNERATPTLVRLDRVFCTMTWDAAFPNNLLQSTAAGISDHYPLVLNLSANKWGKCRFHFESFWPKLPRFEEMVMQAWNIADSGSSPTYPVDRLASKLVTTSRALQSWRSKTVGQVGTQIEQARDILHRLDVAQVRRTLSPEECWLRRSLKQHLLALASLHRTILRTRSRLD